MSSDIRSFFGGGGPVKSKTSASSKDQASTHTGKKQRNRKVVSDEEEEIDVPPKKPSTPKAKKVAKEPKAEETTSSAYFADSSKPKVEKSTPIRAKATQASNGNNHTPAKSKIESTPSTGRRSTRKTTRKNYAENDNVDDATKVIKDDDDNDDDIFVNDFKSKRARDDYEETSDEEDVVVPKTRNSRANGTTKAPKSDDEDEVEVAQISAYNYGGPAKGKHANGVETSGKKRKSKELDDEEEENEELKQNGTTTKKRGQKATSDQSSKKVKPTPKKEAREESKVVQDIFDSIPTVRPPTPPPRDSNRKFQFGGGNTNVAPAAAGTKEIPEGAENCLAGLSFVFTGVLETIGREEGQNLVKRYGGKVTGAPSRKTSYVVLGTDAGPKKLETIRQLDIKTIDEDGLFQLIQKMPANGGDGKAAEAHAEKKAQEEAKIRKDAEEMAEREKAKEKEIAKAAKANAEKTGQPSAPKRPQPKVDSRLWVDKYAPDSIQSVCGNKAPVEGLQKWLRNWHKSAATGFKKAGADGKGIYRTAMLHGPPGVGKTTAAHLVAKLEGFDVVESNASDTRSKRLVETGLRGVLDTTSLLGYFAGDGKKVDSAKKNLVLIMDEVDGMSAGDRGGVGALAAVAKKTNVPMILICNERRLPKMKPFDFVCADFAFRRPTVDMIRGRIATICYREGLKLPMPVISALIEGSNADIRQIINMISTIKLDSKEMDFNDSKSMSKAWEKHVILKPWDIVSKILRPQMFAASSTATLNEKSELYFNDHEFSYLMLQENYLKTQPSLASSYQGDKQRMKLLELADDAAASISDGDLVDRMIHGSQQQWSLMPTHAIFSFVRPASFIYGNFNSQVGFASWLGQNSKQGKLSRYIKEIQGHMRLRSSADRHEVRQQYLPALWNQTVAVLQSQGKESVQEVIDFMDSYYLTKDDFDALLELGVGPMDQSNVNLETQTKSTFTRVYNGQSHPMPFIKASNVLGATKVSKRDKPDLEEAVEDSEADDGALDAEAKEDNKGGEDEEELDLKKDKYVKVPKKKATTTTTGKRKKGAATAEDPEKNGTADGNESDDDDDGSKQTKKKKGGGGGRKGKAKA